LSARRLEKTDKRDQPKSNFILTENNFKINSSWGSDGIKSIKDVLKYTTDTKENLKS